jgi:hypothetical protein
VLSFPFDHSVVFFFCKIKSQHYGQKKNTTLRSKEKDNTTAKRKRQHYGQNKKTTLSPKEKENTGQEKKTTISSKEKDNTMVFFF